MTKDKKNKYTQKTHDIGLKKEITTCFKNGKLFSLLFNYRGTDTVFNTKGNLNIKYRIPTIEWISMRIYKNKNEFLFVRMKDILKILRILHNTNQHKCAAGTFREKTGEGPGRSFRFVNKQFEELMNLPNSFIAKVTTR